ncbi:MAG TPA: FkbM family methyltransferase [Gaiellaceae bacterium]|nr:FkbM family methyltransferase [Gaiellaceae bacterium]
MSWRALVVRGSRVLVRSKAGPPLRALRRRLKPELRRDWRDFEHLRLLLALSLAEDANCVDVGSHEGAVLREILRLAPRGRHIAFEPLPEFHARLAADFPDVDVRPVALSNRSGEASFTYVRTRPGYSGFRPRRYPAAEETESITVTTETLDSSLPEDYVPALIKIDVEGAEEQVLAGAMRTITEHRPTIVFEHGTAAREYGTRPEAIFDLLCKEAGLRIFDLDGNGPYGRTEFAAVCDRGRYWNFVAHA